MISQWCFFLYHIHYSHYLMNSMHIVPCRSPVFNKQRPNPNHDAHAITSNGDHDTLRHDRGLRHIMCGKGWWKLPVLHNLPCLCHLFSWIADGQSSMFYHYYQPGVGWQQEEMRAELWYLWRPSQFWTNLMYPKHCNCVIHVFRGIEIWGSTKCYPWHPRMGPVPYLLSKFPLHALIWVSF